MLEKAIMCIVSYKLQQKPLTSSLLVQVFYLLYPEAVARGLDKLTDSVY